MDWAVSPKFAGKDQEIREIYGSVAVKVAMGPTQRRVGASKTSGQREKVREVDDSGEIRIAVASPGSCQQRVDIGGPQ